MSHLTAAQLATLAEQLRARRSKVMAQIHERLHASDDPDQLALANHLAETDDWVEADMQAGLDLALLDYELVALRDVDAALRHFEAGLAGTCAKCGEAIPLARMLARPTARTCLACQMRLEQRQHADAGAAL
ncbi:MAG: TraR/DksA C4-type zinc finger protein [Pseudomonadota bacterium]